MLDDRRAADVVEVDADRRRQHHGRDGIVQRPGVLEAAQVDRDEVRGVAQSSTRVSALMRQIDASDWMGDPEVERVETKQSGSSRQSEFIVYLKQKRSDSEEDL